MPKFLLDSAMRVSYHEATMFVAAWPSGKAEACKAFIPQFESGCRLFKFVSIIFLVYNFFEICGRLSPKVGNR